MRTSLNSKRFRTQGRPELNTLYTFRWKEKWLDNIWLALYVAVKEACYWTWVGRWLDDWIMYWPMHRGDPLLQEWAPDGRHASPPALLDPDARSSEAALHRSSLFQNSKCTAGDSHPALTDGQKVWEKLVEETVGSCVF